MAAPLAPGPKFACRPADLHRASRCVARKSKSMAANNKATARQTYFCDCCHSGVFCSAVVSEKKFFTFHGSFIHGKTAPRRAN